MYVCMYVAEPPVGKWEKWENGHFVRESVQEGLRFVFSLILHDGIMGKAPKMHELYYKSKIARVSLLAELTMVKNMDTQEEIKNTMNELRDFLIQKNEQYGDSVMQPIRIFSKADTDAGLRIRIDDNWPINGATIRWK